MFRTGRLGLIQTGRWVPPPNAGQSGRPNFEDDSPPTQYEPGKEPWKQVIVVSPAKNAITKGEQEC